MKMIRILQITQLAIRITSVKELQQRIHENLKGTANES